MVQCWFDVYVVKPIIWCHLQLRAPRRNLGRTVNSPQFDVDDESYFANVPMQSAGSSGVNFVSVAPGLTLKNIHITFFQNSVCSTTACLFPLHVS